MAKVKIDFNNMLDLLEYLELFDEKKNYEECGRPKNHIWLTIKSIIRQVNAKENKV